MDILSAVSETALKTLKARVVESEKEKPVIEDAVVLLGDFWVTLGNYGAS